MKKRILSLFLSIVLAGGMLTASALTVMAAGSNDTPFVPWVPETPNVPTEPDIPDIPTVPVTPDVPAEPDIPDTPIVPDTPVFPSYSPVIPEHTDEDINEPDKNDTDTDSHDPDIDVMESAANCKKDSTCPMYSFDDLDTSAWYHDDIHYCLQNGLMNGTGTATFAPDRPLTRAMLVTVLWRLEGETVVDSPVEFTDVPAGEWYTDAVNWASANGIVNGYGDSTFRPVTDVTREQVMAILHRYAAYKGLDSGMIFPMLPQYNYSMWAENDILWADMVGLTSDLGVDIFDMTVSAERVEIAAYLRRFCEAFPEDKDG